MLKSTNVLSSLMSAMTDSLPPNPNSEADNAPNSDNAPRKKLDQDEWIAIIVAFTTIGGILFWGLSNQGKRLGFGDFLTTTPDAVEQEQIIEEESETITEDTLPVPANQNLPRGATTYPQTQAVPRAAIVPVPTSKHWVTPFVAGLVAQGYLTELNNNFQPNQELTREQFASQIVKVFNEQPPTAARKDFPDMPTEVAAQQAIDQAVKLGFMKGYSEGVFRPDQKLSRLELLVSLATGLNLKSQADATEVIKTYQDNAEIPQWAVEQVATATEAGLVVNYPDTHQLNPRQTATQADAIAMLHQALVAQGKLSNVSSPHILYLK